MSGLPLFTRSQAFAMGRRAFVDRVGTNPFATDARTSQPDQYTAWERGNDYEPALRAYHKAVARDTNHDFIAAQRYRLQQLSGTPHEPSNTEAMR